MTDKHLQDERHDLEALYREQSAVEPDAGLDWRIRARAHREGRRARLPRPAQWLGGVAVAASLFVVITLVTRMAPHGSDLRQPPGSTSGTASLDEAAVPAAGRSASSLDVERRRVPVEGDRAAGESAFSPAPPPELSRPAESSGAGQRPSDALIAEERDRSLERLAADRVPLDPELGFSDAKSLPESSADLEAQERLWLIEQFIAVGDAGRARAELERFRDEHPQARVPAELIDALETLSPKDGD